MFWKLECFSSWWLSTTRLE